jgi:predicted nucleic acid-binding protein
VWELRHTITSCDAWYVAIAEALHRPLATLDEKLAKASRGSCEVMTPRS